MAGATLNTGDLVTIRVWSVLGPQAAVNTFHFVMGAESGGTVVTLSDAATSFDADTSSTYIPLLANSAQYRGVQAYVNQVPLPQWQSGTAGAGFGTGGATAMGSQLCGLIEWNTRLAGPAYRGRTFLPFPAAQDNADPGRPGASYQAAANAWIGNIMSISAFVNGVGGSIVAQYVLKHGKNKAGVIPSPSNITAGTFKDVWATQKRRGSLGRPNASPI
jgi:hypothetical protein